MVLHVAVVLGRQVTLRAGTREPLCQHTAVVENGTHCTHANTKLERAQHHFQSRQSLLCCLDVAVVDQVEGRHQPGRHLQDGGEAAVLRQGVLMVPPAILLC